MTDMNDRQKAFEAKYALDQDVMFRIEARTAKLFGLWLAEKMGLNDDEAKLFAAEMVSSNLDEPGFEDLKRAARPKLQAHNIDLTDNELDVHLDKFLEEARVQITEDQA